MYSDVSKLPTHLPCISYAQILKPLASSSSRITPYSKGLTKQGSGTSSSFSGCRPGDTPKSRYSTTAPSRQYLSSEGGAVVSALKEITSTLNTLVKRVESTEHSLKEVQTKLQQSCTPSSSGESATKDDVPLIVRVRTVTLVLLLVREITSIYLCSDYSPRPGRYTRLFLMMTKFLQGLILELSELLWLWGSGAMAFLNINLALPSARQWSRLWYGSWTGFCTNELTYHSLLHTQCHGLRQLTLMAMHCICCHRYVDLSFFNIFILQGNF